MADRNRLIELLNVDMSGCDGDYAEEIADYLIANGVICLPCKVGDTIYFDAPTQVKFFDFEGEGPYWVGGIAFHDVIICGCCGATIEISELYDRAEEIELGKDPIKVLDWIDINHEIKGKQTY